MGPGGARGVALAFALLVALPIVSVAHGSNGLSGLAAPHVVAGAHVSGAIALGQVERTPVAFHLTTGTGLTSGCAREIERLVTCAPAERPAAFGGPTFGVWANLSSAGHASPSARMDSAGIFDPYQGGVVVFGGRASDGARLNDTWLFSQGAWKNISASAGSALPALSNATMGFDPAIDAPVLFGGETDTGLSDQTWALEQGHWRNLTGSLANSPPALARPQLAADAPDNALLLFGGWDGRGLSNQTWWLKNSTWRNLTDTAGGSPTSACCRGAAYMAEAHGVLALGDPVGSSTALSTWVFTKGQWVRWNASDLPTPRADAMLAYDPDARASMLFGGEPTRGPMLADTWAFRNGTWWNVSSRVGNPPGPRSSAIFAYSPTERAVVLFGGFSRAGETALGDTWLLSGAPPPTVSMVVSSQVGEVGRALHLSAFPGSTGTPPFTLAWTFGDGAGGTGMNVSHTYAASGNYSPTVTIRDAAGRTNSSSLPIEIAGPLTIVASVSAGQVDVGVPIQFRLSLAGGVVPTSVRWSFGDGGSSALRDPTYTYSSSGRFAARAWANDSLGASATQAVSVLVVPLPAVRLGGSTATSDVGLNIYFNASVTGGVAPLQYRWDFDGAPSTAGPTVAYSFAQPGAHRVNVTVTDSDGIASAGSFWVHINPLPQLRLVTNVSETDVGLPVRFTPLVVGGTSPFTQRWSFDQDSEEATGPAVLQFTSEGLNEIGLTVTDALGAKVRSATLILVNPLPTVLVSVDSSQASAGQAVAFSARAGGGVGPWSAVWSFGDGSTGVGLAASHTFAAPGPYLVGVALTDGVGQSASAQASVYVAVAGTPPAPGPSVASGAPAPDLLALGLIGAGFVGLALVGVLALRSRSRR